MKNVLISIVIPCYNEEKNVIETYKQLSLVTKSLRSYQFEYIFVDNGSLDGTRSKITQLVEASNNVVGVFLSRNFGPESSGLAGLEYAKGEATIVTVCDLQDPIEKIPLYLERWREGYDIVIGVYTKTEDIFWMAWMRSIYYKIFKAVSNIDIPINSAGMCLYSKNSLRALFQMKERFRSSVGIRAWIGFKTASIPYERKDRSAGKSSYNFIRYLQTAERSFVGFSYLPLDSIIYVGLFIFLCSFVFLFVYGIGVVFQFISWNIGTGILATITLFGGLQLLAISAIGKYIQVIVEETKQRPLYIVETVIHSKKMLR